MRSRTGNRLAVAAVIAAATGSALLLFLPGYTTVAATGGPGTEVVTEVRRERNLLEMEGLRVVLLSLFPLVLAAGGLWSRKDARVIAASFLWLFVLAGAISIGLYFAPAAILMTLAAVKTPRASAAR